MVASSPSPIRVQGTADGVPTSTETGRQRKSSHGLLALRRSTTTPTTILASAVDLTPYLQSLTWSTYRDHVGYAGRTGIFAFLRAFVTCWSRFGCAHPCVSGHPHSASLSHGPHTSRQPLLP